MTKLLDDLTTRFIATLQEHLAGGGEATLLRAYDLGRRALAEQHNALEMLTIQQDALVAVLLQHLGSEESARITQAASDVFTESLAPFELARRSSQEGNALLRHVNEELERQVAARTAELMETNQTLRHEIAQRQHAEAALRESQELFQSFMDHSPTMAYIKDDAGRYIYANQPLIAYFQQETGNAEWHDKTDVDLWPGDRAEQFQSNDQAALQAERTVVVEETTVTRDGEQTWLSFKFPLQVGSGQRFLAGVSVDITERKRMEAWLESLVNTTQDAVIAIDRQGRIVRFNPAAELIFGYSGAEVRGQKVNMLMVEPHAREHDSYIARYEQTHQPRVIGRVRTEAARRKNGEVFPIELSLVEVTVDPDVRYAAFIRDISEKVRLQERLLERERLAAIGATAAKLVHEIGNPLNSMSMATQLLQRRLEKEREQLDDKVFASMQSLRGEIARLANLVQDFRSLSRHQQVTLRPTDVRTVVTEVLAAESPYYTTRGVKVAQTLPADLPPVPADADKLKQVVLNLCKNAVEAMPTGGTLTVRVHNSHARITIEVIDTGVGIPSGVNIFEPFVTTKAEGTGLGLPIVWQIVEGHRGTLTYTSTPGQGTTFTISLPVMSTADDRLTHD